MRACVLWTWGATVGGPLSYVCAYVCVYVCVYVFTCLCVCLQYFLGNIRFALALCALRFGW